MSTIYKQFGRWHCDISAEVPDWWEIGFAFSISSWSMQCSIELGLLHFGFEIWRATRAQIEKAERMRA